MGAIARRHWHAPQPRAGWAKFQELENGRCSWRTRCGSATGKALRTVMVRFIWRSLSFSCFASRHAPHPAPHTPTPARPLAVKPENVLLLPHGGFSVPNQGPGSVTAAHRAAGKALLEAAASLPDPVLSAPAPAMHNYMVQLCDFGAALVVQPSATEPALGITPRGSTMYACPQVVAAHTQRQHPDLSAKLWPTDSAASAALGDGYDAYGADVWSYGVSLFRAVTGRLPFRLACSSSGTFRAFVISTQPHVRHDAVVAPHADIWAKDEEFIRAGGDASWAWPSLLSPALVHLLRGCLAVRESERFTMGQVLEHPWFTRPHWVPPAAPVIATPRLPVSPRLQGAVPPLQPPAGADAQTLRPLPSDPTTGSACSVSGTDVSTATFSAGPPGGAGGGRASSTPTGTVTLAPLGSSGAQRRPQEAAPHSPAQDHIKPPVLASGRREGGAKTEAEVDAGFIVGPSSARQGVCGGGDTGGALSGRSSCAPPPSTAPPSGTDASTATHAGSEYPVSPTGPPPPVLAGGPSGEGSMTGGGLPSILSSRTGSGRVPCTSRAAMSLSHRAVAMPSQSGRAGTARQFPATPHGAKRAAFFPDEDAAGGPTSPPGTPSARQGEGHESASSRRDGSVASVASGRGGARITLGASAPPDPSARLRLHPLSPGGTNSVVCGGGGVSALQGAARSALVPLLMPASALRRTRGKAHRQQGPRLETVPSGHSVEGGGDTSGRSTCHAPRGSARDAPVMAQPAPDATLTFQGQPTTPASQVAGAGTAITGASPRTVKLPAL